MKKTIKKIFYLLDYDDKKKTIIFIFLLLLTTFLETLSFLLLNLVGRQERVKSLQGKD